MLVMMLYALENRGNPPSDYQDSGYFWEIVIFWCMISLGGSYPDDGGDYGDIWAGEQFPLDIHDEDCQMLLLIKASCQDCFMNNAYDGKYSAIMFLFGNIAEI